MIRPAALLDHRPQGRFATVEGALQIGLDHDIPGLFAHHHKQGVARSSRVVDQNVDPTEPLHRLFDQPLRVGEEADIGLDGEGLTTGRDDLGDDGFGLGRAIAVVDHDGCALAGKLDGDGRPDAARGAGHNSDLVLQHLI